MPDGMSQVKKSRRILLPPGPDNFQMHVVVVVVVVVVVGVGVGVGVAVVVAAVRFDPLLFRETSDRMLPV